MQAGKYDFVMEQGAVFDENVYWILDTGIPKNITGYSAKMSIRQTVNSVAAIFSLYTTPTPGCGTITITGSSGKVRLYANADLTRALSFTSAVYDLELASDGTDPHTSDYAVRLLEGKITFSKEVTK
jgi:hypothetical protein